MVEMDLEDERFVEGNGGYTMPLQNEEGFPDDEEGTSNADDSDYEVRSSDATDEEGRSGLSGGWWRSRENADAFMNALLTIIDSGGTATTSVEDEMEKVFVSPAGEEYFQYTNEVGQVLIDAQLVVYHVNIFHQVCAVDRMKVEYTY